MPKTTNPLLKKSGPSTNMILSIVVVVGAILIVGGILLFTASQKGDDQAGGGGPAPAPGADVSGIVAHPDSNKLLEAPDGKVTVAEFLDFQCPTCWNYYTGVTQTIEKEFAGRITFVNRNFPIAKAHPLAETAAQAAEAGAAQGKYKEMYHALYENYRAWAISPDGQSVSDDKARADKLFTQYAQQSGLDVDKFHADMGSPAVAERIKADQADAQKAGVEGTPTFFINGQKWEPSQNAKNYGDVAAQLREKLNQELAK
ncbi:thioredoxin domain-containing protein [Saccharopolyspora sp. NFXS83]|uniref:DsbA family protein n=1 Tax=Saccharopolyspora sp. NFXS83 TaxID=2993560 RepID=UPI00224B8DB0|nr:thioredoxin domain-containing protein [Saccharopolyspora sp. NFXS83]MCX2729934.1 thioredoxin domain-containing protein [Saccharopolyspora sp. NFXS83]